MAVRYAYDNTGALATVTDSASGLKTTYYYDLTDRLMKYTRNGDNYAQTVGYVYDRENKLTGRNWTVSGTTYSETYTYNNAEGYLSGYTNGLGESISLNYDSLRRLSSVTGGKYTRTYTYRDISATKTTTQVSQLAYSGVTGAPTYGYTYDVRGNIATYNQNGTAFTYTYDTQNQLLSQTGGGKTYSYTYDAAGNILTASDGTTSHSYTYGDANWGDLLTAYDGQSISYDGAGNPTSYYNGTRWTMNWQKGRQLASATNGTTSVAYTYDSEGLRLTKATGDLVYHYYYADGKLVRIHLYKGATSWQIFDFFYDQNGHPYALNHKVGGVYTTYYYLTNLQGDVLGMVKADGTTVATYTYDPYGKPLTATGTFAATNPLRYRGYCYDTETGLYYLQSRYYDPQMGRFISPDALVSTGQGILGNNMFAYCGNNPVNRVDVGGRAYAHVGTKEERIILTGGGSVPVGGGVVLPVDPLLIDALFDSVEDAAKKIIAWVETQTGKEEFDNNSVYILVDPNDGNLTKYVGRTVNPIRRAYEHKNDPLHYWRKDYEMIVVATSLSKEDSILFEQALISAYTLAYLENARREIAKKNISKFTSYVGAVAEIITDVPANDILKLITER